MPGKVLVTCPHFTQVSALARNGILCPEATDNDRWIGFVVGVGAGVPYLEFGDAVEITRWEKSVLDGGSLWHSHPGKLAGQWGANADFSYESPDGCRRVAVDGTWRLALYHWSEVIYRAARYGEYDNGWVEPLGSKLLIRNRQRSGDANGLHLHADYYRSPPPVGEIVAMGDGVDSEDFAAGDWVLVEPNKGTLVKVDGAEMTIIHTKAVLVNCGKECPQIEMNGAAA